MQRQSWRLYAFTAIAGMVLGACLVESAWAQTALTWDQIKARFETTNPTLIAGRASVEESKAQEITANLRPNPDFTTGLDQIDPFTANPFRPFNETFPLLAFSYEHERRHKRELRLESAKKGTAVAVAQQADLERNLLFTLRNAFVQTLQAKAVLQNARENLTYWDHELQLNSDRFNAGDIARVDLMRLQLQRAQFESDLQNAQTSLLTAKIQLLQLLDDRTPWDQFDVTGPFDFSESVRPIEEFHNIALETRPDLKAAEEALDKAHTDHTLAVANGSTDPTFGVDIGRNPPIPVYFGVSVNIPLRIFDRNQGEKLRTQIDIGRTEKLRDASRAQVFSDVDTAYATLGSNINLLKSYKATYLTQAEDVRDTISFSFQHGSASLLDYLDAQKSYRDVRLAYLTLIGSYLTAASQLNLAVGREVIP